MSWHRRVARVSRSRHGRVVRSTNGGARPARTVGAGRAVGVVRAAPADRNRDRHARVAARRDGSGVCGVVGKPRDDRDRVGRPGGRARAARAGPAGHARSCSRARRARRRCARWSPTPTSTRRRPRPPSSRSIPAQWPFGAPPTSATIAARPRARAAPRPRATPRAPSCGAATRSTPAIRPSGRHGARSSTACRGLAHRLVPGNHDICFNRPFDEDYTLARRAERERAYQQHAGRLADFPMLDTIITDAGPAHVVLLDSCRHRSTHVLSNAIGRFGDAQLDELERMLARCAARCSCVAHHHVWRDAQFLSPRRGSTPRSTPIGSSRSCRVSPARRAQPRARLSRPPPRADAPASSASDADRVRRLAVDHARRQVGPGQLDGMLRYAVAGLRRDGSWGVTWQAVGAL